MNDASDYNNAIEEFCTTCGQLEDAVVSILLYGSLARGDIRPGRSDVLDATLVLQNHALEDETAFHKTLAVMLQACEKLADTGLPFHPFHYFTYAEICRCYWRLYLQPWKSNHSSRVLRGADIRPLFRSVDEDGWLTRGAIFIEYRVVEKMVRFLGMDLTLIDNRARVLHGLRWFLKTIPHLACVACNYEVDPAQAINVLDRYLEGVDAARLCRLQRLRDAEPENISPEETRAVVNDILEANQELVNGVSAWMKKNEQWDTFINTVLGFDP